MIRGFSAPLSPAEETTLRRVHAGIKLADLNGRHIERLVSLGLVSLDEGVTSLTDAGRRRVEETLPPERAAAQRLREAVFFGHILGGTPLKPPSHPPKPAPKANPKA